MRRVRQPQPENPDQSGEKSASKPDQSGEKTASKPDQNEEKSTQKPDQNASKSTQIESNPTQKPDHSSSHTTPKPDHSSSHPTPNPDHSALADLEELEDGDRTSRALRSVVPRGQVDSEEAAERQLGFAKARAKEEVKNRELRGESRGEEPVEDGLLSEWLLRARRVVLGKRRNSTEEVAKRIAMERETEKVETEKEETDVDRVSEFVKRFKSVMAEQEREKQNRETEKRNGETEKPQDGDHPVPHPSNSGETGETEETGETGEDETASHPSESKLQKSEEKSESEPDVEEFFEPPTLGKGLGDALKYLRAQKVEDVEEEAYGRRNDTVIKSSNEEGRVVHW